MLAWDRRSHCDPSKLPNSIPAGRRSKATHGAKLIFAFARNLGQNTNWYCGRETASAPQKRVAEKTPYTKCPLKLQRCQQFMTATTLASKFDRRRDEKAIEWGRFRRWGRRRGRKENGPGRPVFASILAERGGIEPPLPCGKPDFESGTFNHSATSPRLRF